MRHGREQPYEDGIRFPIGAWKVNSETRGWFCNKDGFMVFPVCWSLVDGDRNPVELEVDGFSLAGMGRMVTTWVTTLEKKVSSRCIHVSHLVWNTA